MENISERLKQLREATGKSKSDFARFTGIEQSRYSNFEAGKNKPAQDALTLIAERMPELNLHWLLTGKGQMFTDRKPDVVQPPVMSAMQEAKELAEMRADRDMWREMALSFVRARNSSNMAATGTDGAPSFPLGNLIAAELTAAPLKMVV